MFNKSILAGMSPEAAAAATWTGQQAAKLGFTNVRVLETTGAHGAFESVKVAFTKGTP
jgi:hypothetical protein